MKSVFKWLVPPMSLGWWIALFLSLAVTAGLTAWGLVCSPPGFLGNLIAEGSGVTLGLALAIWLIEGRIATSEASRRHEVIAEASDIATEIETGARNWAIELARDVGEHTATPRRLPAAEYDTLVSPAQEIFNAALGGDYSIANEMSDERAEWWLRDTNHRLAEWHAEVPGDLEVRRHFREVRRDQRILQWQVNLALTKLPYGVAAQARLHDLGMVGSRLLKLSATARAAQDQFAR